MSKVDINKVKEQYMLFVLSEKDIAGLSALIHAEIAKLFFPSPGAPRGMDHAYPGILDVIQRFADWESDPTIREWIRDRHGEARQLYIEKTMRVQEALRRAAEKRRLY